MSTLAHTLAGITIGVVITKIFQLENFVFVLVAIFFSLLPDINLLWKRVKEHHSDFTHYPIFINVISILYILISYLFFPQSLILSITIFVSLNFHYFLDTFGFRLGLKWFYPLLNKEFSFRKLNDKNFEISKKDYWNLVLKSGFLYYELVVLIIFVSIIVVTLLFF